LRLTAVACREVASASVCASTRRTDAAVSRVASHAPSAR